MKLLEFAGKVFIPSEKITGFCPDQRQGDGWVFIATGADGADAGCNGFSVKQDIEEVAAIIRAA
jgi:hypothetical protein